MLGNDLENQGVGRGWNHNIPANPILLFRSEKQWARSFVLRLKDLGSNILGFFFDIRIEIIVVVEIHNIQTTHLLSNNATPDSR